MDIIDEFVAHHKREYQNYINRLKLDDSSRVRALFCYGHKDFSDFENKFYDRVHVHGEDIA